MTIPTRACPTRNHLPYQRPWPYQPPPPSNYDEKNYDEKRGYRGKRQLYLSL